MAATPLPNPLTPLHSAIHLKKRPSQICIIHLWLNEPFTVSFLQKKKKIPTFLVFFWLTHLRGASSSHQLLLLLAVAQAEDSGKLGPGLTSGCAAVQRVRISWSQQWPPPSRRSYKSQAVPRPDQALLGTEGRDALGGRIGRSSRGTESVSASLCSSPSPAVHLVPHPLHLHSPLPSSSSAAANVATIQNIPSPSQLLL